MLASNNNHLDVVKFLLDQGADINCVEKGGLHDGDNWLNVSRLGLDKL